MLGLECVQSIDRSGEAVDGLVLIANRDDLAALLLDDLADDGAGVLSLI